MSDLPTTKPRTTLVTRLAGFTAPVSARLYLATGLGLMVLKHAVDAGVIFAFTGKLISPLLYLLPLATIRADIVQGAPDLVVVALVLWTLPFAWIGASMSVRRAQDAGLPGMVGLLFFVPFVNYLMMAALAFAPSRPTPAPKLPLQGSDRVVASALTGIAAGGAISAVVLAIATVTSQYGAMAFMGVPFLTAATAGFLFNLRGTRAMVPTLVVGWLTMLIGEGLLLLFAVEGAVCLLMASPLATALATGGVLFGRELARIEGRKALTSSYAILPLLGFLEEPPQMVHPISTTVEIAASPDAVWDAVIGFPDIPESVVPAWYFQLGVAYPVRAHIEGSGVGAVRHCEFSTGAFVEPITVWDPPHRLAFDVVDNPPTMEELSPYDHVLAPHLEDDLLRSERGEFLLEPLPGGGTRLTGTTWYRFGMAPTWYWNLWSDAIIRRIHLRVLDHVGQVAEASR